MTYLAITQGTADWLLPKVGLLDEILSVLKELVNGKNPLGEFIFSHDSLRISKNNIDGIISIWNVDYITGTGYENWGFIKIDGNFSICNVPNIEREVFERSIFTVNQRLQGYIIDSVYYLRRNDNGVNTLLSGRGNIARHYSIGYFEKSIREGSNEARSIICIGPGNNFSLLNNETTKEGSKLDHLLRVTIEKFNKDSSNKSVSLEVFPSLRNKLSAFGNVIEGTDYDNVQVFAGESAISKQDALKNIGLSYSDWMDAASSLNEVQRRILNSGALENHPLRILGPGGSGKSLLMQLLAIKKLNEAQGNKNILYIVHSGAMRELVLQRFEVLMSEKIPGNGFINGNKLFITTLSEYCRIALNIELKSVIEPDADDAKVFQHDQVLDALKTYSQKYPSVIHESNLLRSVYSNEALLNIFSRLVVAEISVAIKGHGLESDRKRYIESEKILSRLHGILNIEERKFIFDIFEIYHDTIFNDYGVLDPDDIALSLFGRLKTPLWQLQRSKEGFDYVFVDEAQLFNENERRILPLLTKGDKSHVPIALALDQAQSFYGQAMAGLSTIGITDISSENLQSIHRSTSAIVKLAFYIIQQSTDLFGPDFPDFTVIAKSQISEKIENSIPKLEKESQNSPNFGKFILRQIRDLRKDNFRQIAIICHSEIYWKEIESELSGADLPFQVIRERGELLVVNKPLVVLCRPAQIGGQEFDAVLIIGLEYGVSPPKYINNSTLNAAVEQQTIRETYLSITRARYRVVFALSKNSEPNSLLSRAISSKLINVSQ